MKPEQLTIGKMAGLNRISEQTLRLYDKMGLMPPAGVNTENGYRYYTIGQSAELDLIQYYQRIGFSLKDIHAKLLSPDAGQINHQLRQRSEELSREIHHLEKCRRSIETTLKNYQYYQSLPKGNSPFLEYLPENRIITFHTGENLLEIDYERYEYHLCQFKNYLMDINLDVPLLGSVGTIIRKKYLESNQLFSSEMFLILDEHTEQTHNMETIPSGTYLSLCCNDFSREEQYARKLLYEAARTELQIKGDYYCEVLSEYPQLSIQKRQFYYKIRIKLV